MTFGSVGGRDGHLDCRGSAKSRGPLGIRAVVLSVEFGRMCVRVPDGFIQDYRAMTFESFKQSRQAAENFTEHHPVDELLGRAGIRPLVVFGANDKIVKPAR